MFNTTDYVIGELVFCMGQLIAWIVTLEGESREGRGVC